MVGPDGIGIEQEDMGDKVQEQNGNKWEKEYSRYTWKEEVMTWNSENTRWIVKSKFIQWKDGRDSESGGKENE